MKPFSIEEKIFIWECVYDRIRKLKQDNICSALMHTLEDEFDISTPLADLMSNGDVKLTTLHFPEFVKRKPKGKELTRSWFPYTVEGKLERLEIVESIIKELIEQK